MYTYISCVHFNIFPDLYIYISCIHFNIFPDLYIYISCVHFNIFPDLYIYHVFTSTYFQTSIYIYHVFTLTYGLQLNHLKFTERESALTPPPSPSIPLISLVLGSATSNGSSICLFLSRCRRGEGDGGGGVIFRIIA